MSRYTVIGLGKFGGQVARELHRKKHEVIGIDSDADRVDDLKEHVTQAIVADCTDPETLRSLEVGSSHGVIVSLGERMDASILVTMHVKKLIDEHLEGRRAESRTSGRKHVELPSPRIVVKAISDDHGAILKMIGATNVVHPEIDTATRWARVLGSRGWVEYLPLGPGFSLIEMTAPAAFVGQTLGDLQFRNRYQINLAAVKRGEEILVPGPDYRFAADDLLFILGRDEHIENFTRQA